MQVLVDATIVWKVLRTPRGVLVGVCDELRLTVEARDERELRSIIEESHDLFFQSLLEDGELGRFLREHGWDTNVPVADLKVGQAWFEAAKTLLDGEV